MNVFDPYTSVFIKPSWHKNIIMVPKPDKSRVYGIEITGGDCCIWNGWNNGLGEGKDYGLVRIGKDRWYLHRWTFSCHHDVNLATDDIVDHICRRRLCFNPYHHECVTPLENFIRGDGPLHKFKSSRGKIGETMEDLFEKPPVSVYAVRLDPDSMASYINGPNDEVEGGMSEGDDTPF